MEEDEYHFIFRQPLLIKTNRAKRYLAKSKVQLHCDVPFRLYHILSLSYPDTQSTLYVANMISGPLRSQS